MSTCPVPDIIDAIISSLNDSEDLAGVTIRSGPFDATGVTEVLQLNEIIFEDDQVTMGPARREYDFRVTGVIECTKPGAGEATISAARTRTFAIMDIVESILVDQLAVDGVDFRDGEIITGKYVGGLADNGHRGHLEFTVHLIAGLG